MYKVCVIVISNKGYTGEEEDISGKLVEEYLKKNKFNIAAYSIVPEKKEIFKRFVIKCCDEYEVDLIITLGNISIANDVNRDIQDINDLQKYDFNYIDGSRAYFTFRGNTAIINFPYKLEPSEIPIETIEKVLKDR